MTDGDKTATDKPVAPADEPKAPAADPSASPAAPAGGADAPGSTDQYGRQVFEVKCASCGNDAKVPFKPAGDRPVYCRDCYMQQRKGGPGR